MKPSFPNKKILSSLHWDESIADCKTFDELPEDAKAYINFIEEYIGVPVKFIGTGAEREAMIVR